MSKTADATEKKLAPNEVRNKITQKMMKMFQVDPDVKQQALQTAIFEATQSHEFIGNILQILHIEYSYQLPTAGVSFDSSNKVWRLFINPFYFCKCLSHELRHSLLIHELQHIIYKHPTRLPFARMAPDKTRLMNVAMDMVINQRIKHISKGCDKCPPPFSGEQCINEHDAFDEAGELMGTGLCPRSWIDVKDYQKMAKQNGSSANFALDRSSEQYYEALLQLMDDNEEKGDGDGDGDGKGKGAPRPHGDHNWDNGGSEADMLDATEELVKRTMVKMRYDFDKLPNSVKELLQEIDARRADLNYKAIILMAIKAHASGHERKHTWARKSKRYGYMSPGTKVGNLPMLEMFIDTSGSISIEEANMCLETVDQFLKVGSRKCWLNLFHTKNYYHKIYKLGTKIKKEEFESGGTCLEHSMRMIAKNNPDLAIIYTDGYYDNIDVESWMKGRDTFPHCVFIITQGGQADHPLVRLGTTIKIPEGT